VRPSRSIDSCTPPPNTHTHHYRYTLTSQLGLPGSAATMMQPSRALAELTTPPKTGTNCTTPSLIPTVTGNTVHSFSTHGQLSAAQGRGGGGCVLASPL
jgi:hypothetical protein